MAAPRLAAALALLAGSLAALGVPPDARAQTAPPAAASRAASGPSAGDSRPASASESRPANARATKAPATAAPPAGQSDPAALARVERALAALDSVRADFVQELFDPRTRAVQRAEGTLSIRRPGRFRWDYRTPEQTIVSDGERLWLYDADLEQVTVRRVRETLSQTPAMLLSGQARIGDGFVVRGAGRRDGLEWVRLEPRLRDTDFRELLLGFEGDALRRMEFEDKLDQQTRIELVRVERNVRLDERTFTFVPPPGVDVIGAPH